METIRTLLDAVKAKTPSQTDSALADALGVRRQRIYDYYKGIRTPDNYICKCISDLLERPLPEVIAIVELDAEKEEKRKAAWRDYYKSIGGIAESIALLFFLAVNLIVTPTPANASEREISKPNALYYVKSACQTTIQKVVAFVQHMLSTVIPHFGFSG